MNKRDSFLNKHMLNPYCSLPHRGDNDDLLALVRSLSGRHYKYQLQSLEALKFFPSALAFYMQQNKILISSPHTSTP